MTSTRRYWYTAFLVPSWNLHLTAVVLVDHKFQALSDRFLVETTPNDLIYHLKKKVKQTTPIYFSRLAVDVRELVVWKTMGEMVINTHTQRNMAMILGKINALYGQQCFRSAAL